MYLRFWFFDFDTLNKLFCNIKIKNKNKMNIWQGMELNNILIFWKLSTELCVVTKNILKTIIVPRYIRKQVLLIFKIENNFWTFNNINKYSVQYWLRLPILLRNPKNEILLKSRTMRKFLRNMVGFDQNMCKNTSTNQNANDEHSGKNHT